MQFLMSAEISDRPESHVGRMKVFIGLVLSATGLLTSLGVFRFLVLLGLHFDFGMRPIELCGVPFCAAGLFVNWSSRRSNHVAQWSVMLAIAGLTIAAVIAYVAFTFDGGRV